MMTIHAFGHTRSYEMEALLKLFIPATQFSFSIGETPELPDGEYLSAVLEQVSDDTNRLTCRTAWNGQTHTQSALLSAAVQGNDLDREISAQLYPQLCEISGQTLPWGMLTGIRPVNLLRRFTVRDGGLQNAMDTFRRVWHVSDQKTKLAARILQVQQPIFDATPPDAVSIYVSIPFCPTRCRYCSFVSNSVSRMKQTILPQYLEKLRDEIILVSELIAAQNLTIDTLYIGGGTPTVLDAAQLADLMGWLDTYILSAPDGKCRIREYTVEAGRPDTITREKLQVLLDSGVTRISVNPQSFQDNVLEAAGRPHTAQDTVDQFLLAKEMGFRNINMDFIAGLPCDTIEGFRESIDRAIALSPESITVHCLSLKKAADFYASLPMPGAQTVNDMVEYAQRMLLENGYAPYYLYRQKNMAANLENVGYAKPGFESPYNILMMDDSQSILGIGSGASTKLIGGQRGIERVTECKYPDEYLRRYDELMAKKRSLVIPKH